MSSERSVKDLSGLYTDYVAERVGFEPTGHFDSTQLTDSAFL